MTTSREEMGKWRDGVLVEPSAEFTAEMAAAEAERQAARNAIDALKAAAKDELSPLFRLVSGATPWPTTNAGWQAVIQQNTEAIVAMAKYLNAELQNSGD